MEHKWRKYGEFEVLAFNIKPSSSDEDKQLLEIVEREIEKVQANDKNTSGESRSPEVLYKDRYIGVIAEILLYGYLKKELKAIGAEVVREDFLDCASHVDLVVKKGNTTRTIEVRGSYPYCKDFNRVLTELFDIIGPYATKAKPGECVKDYYLRVLINEGKNEFNTKADHTIYFVGGAERNHFIERGIITTYDQDGAQYIAIKPITRGRDAKQVVQMIKNDLTINELDLQAKMLSHK